jgi:SAM-dependent methyltransferase
VPANERLGIDWTLVKKAKNSAEDQLDLPILQIPIISDYRGPLVDFLRPGMSVLDIGAHDRSLKIFLEHELDFAVNYKSMDIDRSHEHDYYSLDGILEQFDAIVCFEVVEHLTPAMVRNLLGKIASLLRSNGQLFISTPNVYHPMSFWSDSTHITPFRLGHLAGWMKLAGFTRLWGYRVCRMTWKKKLRYWRYRGLLRLLNLDFAPGILVVGGRDAAPP